LETQEWKDSGTRLQSHRATRCQEDGYGEKYRHGPRIRKTEDRRDS